MKGADSDDNEKNKKISFDFSFADEKSDILSENDDFLVSSSFLNSSEEVSSLEGEIIQEKQQNILASNFARQSRPSFWRKSLAWDSAFFNSAGILDPDEMSFINKGFSKTESHLLSKTQDVCNRRFESGLMPNGDDFSVDWFEIEPSVSYPNSCRALNLVERIPESRFKQEAFKKVDKSSRNKSSTEQKTIGSAAYLSARVNSKDLTGRSNLKMENKSVTTGSGQLLIMEKKSTSLNSPNLNSVSVSSPKFSSIVSSASSLLKRKTKSSQSQHSASLPTSKIWRHAEKKKGMGSISASTRSLSLLSPNSCLLPASSSTSHGASASLSSSVGNEGRSNESNDAKVAADLQSPLSLTNQYSSLSAKSIRPSGLRQPSPKIRFSNENTPPLYQGATGSRKMPQKVLSERTAFGVSTQFDYLTTESLHDSSMSSKRASARKNFKSQCSDVAKNTKRPKTELTNIPLVVSKEICLESRGVEDHGKHSRLKLELNSTVEEEEKRGEATGVHTGATKQENEKKYLSFSVNQLDDLSRYFEAIDLNKEKATEFRNKHTDLHPRNNGVPAHKLLKRGKELLDLPIASSKPSRLSPPSLTTTASILCTRAPLADKTSTCNFSGSFVLRKERKKEKMVQKGSSVCTSSEVSDKENS